MKEKSFKIYIFRLLKNTSKKRISREAIEALDSVIRVVASKLVNRATELTTQIDHKTISEREVLSACQLLFPNDIYNLISARTKTVLECYQKEETEEKSQLRETKCGIIFSVSTAEKYLRQFEKSSLHVAATAPVVLATGLEVFCKYLLESVSTVAENSDRITISIRHLFLATTNSTFLQSLGIVFLNSGVVPEDLPTRRSRSRTVSGVLRACPGVRTLQNIKELQKNNDLLIQHAPFNRLVREIIGKQDKVRYTNEFFLSLQSYIEMRLVRLLLQSNRIVEHAGRETLYVEDIKLVCHLTDVYLTENDYTSKIPDASLRNISLRAGVKRYSDNCSQILNKYIYSQLENILDEMLICLRHLQTQTMTVKLFLSVLNMHNIYPALISHARKIKRSTSRVSSAVVMDEPELSDVEEEKVAS